VDHALRRGHRAQALQAVVSVASRRGGCEARRRLQRRLLENEPACRSGWFQVVRSIAMRYPAGLVLRDLRTAKARSVTAVNYRLQTLSCSQIGWHVPRYWLARGFIFATQVELRRKISRKR
jgi:hypothetical protein